MRINVNLFPIFSRQFRVVFSPLKTKGVHRNMKLKNLNNKTSPHPDQAKTDSEKNMRLLRGASAVQSAICLIWVVMWVSSDVARLKSGQECSLFELFLVATALIAAIIGVILSLDFTKATDKS